MMSFVGIPHFAMVVRGEYPPLASTVIYCTPSRITTFDAVLVPVALHPEDWIITKPMIAMRTRAITIESALLGGDFLVIE
jgi:hypothetical protein